MREEVEDIAAFFNAAEGNCESSSRRILSEREAEELIESEGGRLFWRETCLRQDQIDAVYELLFAVLRICECNQVEVWADGGTLLGALRHGGFIPWDDDADLALHSAQSRTFRSQVLPQLHASGYGVSLTLPL